MEITLKITDEEKAATLLALFALLDFVEVLPPAGEEEKNALTSEEEFLLQEEQEIPPLTASSPEEEPPTESATPLENTLTSQLLGAIEVPEEVDNTLSYKEMRNNAIISRYEKRK